MPPYERLQAWRASHDLVLVLYRTSDSWPRSERYGLTGQVRRAAFSVAANIAEGAAKRSRKDFRRFLDMALGSMSELTYALRLARDLGYLNDALWERLEAQRDAAGRLLWGLYRSKSQSEVG